MLSLSLASKYADLLQGSDIVELFDTLGKLHGSISKAARACGLERKTIYDWKRKAGSEELKPGTKRKVVTALLEQVPEKTLAFMLERVASQAQELFDIYISTVYENTISETEPEEFSLKAEELRHLTEKFGALIAGRRESEISGMLRQISQKAKQLGQVFALPIVQVFSSDHLERLLPTALSEARRLETGDTGQIRKVAEKLGMPQGVIGALMERPEVLTPNRPLPVPIGRAPAPAGLSVESLGGQMTSLLNPTEPKVAIEPLGQGTSFT